MYSFFIHLKLICRNQRLLIRKICVCFLWVLYSCLSVSVCGSNNYFVRFLCTSRVSAFKFTILTIPTATETNIRATATSNSWTAVDSFAASFEWQTDLGHPKKNEHDRETKKSFRILQKWIDR